MRTLILMLYPVCVAACSETVISNGRIGGSGRDGDIGVTHITADLAASAPARRR